MLLRHCGTKSVLVGLSQGAALPVLGDSPVYCLGTNPSGKQGVGEKVGHVYDPVGTLHQ